MSELLPCPFCGGEADVIDYDDECWVAHQCANGTSVETNSYETEAEAIAAWNSRAERTCKWELEHSGTPYDKWRCSKCGYLFVEPRCDQGYTDLEPNYCPNCGAKVVDE